MLTIPLMNAGSMALQEMSRTIAACLGEWFGRGARLAPRVELHKRAWSFFVRYTVERPSRGEIGILVKVPRDPGMHAIADAMSAQHLAPITKLEYDALVGIWNTFAGYGGQGFHAVRPIDFLPEWNAIVMEQLAARPIKRLLLKPSMILRRAENWAEFERVLTQAGRWLSIFHEQVGSRRVEPFPAAAARENLDEVLMGVERATRGRASIAGYRDALDRQLEAIADRPIWVANLHGDWSCSNIFVTSEGAVGVLDTDARLRGPVYSDLAMLINDPPTRVLQVMSQGFAFRAQDLERCRAAVLRGYFGSSPYDKQALDFYSTLTVLRKWEQDERALARLRFGRLLAPFATPGMRRYFHGLLHGTALV